MCNCVCSCSYMYMIFNIPWMSSRCVYVCFVTAHLGAGVMCSILSFALFLCHMKTGSVRSLVMTDLTIALLQHRLPYVPLLNGCQLQPCLAKMPLKESQLPNHCLDLRRSSYISFSACGLYFKKIPPGEPYSATPWSERNPLDLIKLSSFANLSLPGLIC